MAEEWKTIWNGVIQVSSLGRVKVYRTDKRTGRTKWYLRVPHFDDGYLRVNVNVCGRRAVKVHSLVAEGFLGPRPMGKEVNHKDLDRSNCRPKNLEYKTHAENIAYSVAAGSYDNRGSANPRAILNEENVVVIRKMIKRGLRDRVIGEKFGVSGVLIWHIRKGNTWTHV